MISTKIVLNTTSSSSISGSSIPIYNSSSNIYKKGQDSISAGVPKSSNNKLPQTGESSNLLLALFGTLIVLISGVMLVPFSKK